MLNKTAHELKEKSTRRSFLDQTVANQSGNYAAKKIFVDEDAKSTEERKLIGGETSGLKEKTAFPLSSKLRLQLGLIKTGQVSGGQLSPYDASRHDFLVFPPCLVILVLLSLSDFKTLFFCFSTVGAF